MEGEPAAESAADPIAEVSSEQVPPARPDNELPVALAPARLKAGVFHWSITRLWRRSEPKGELLSLPPQVPDEILERILNGLWPPHLQTLLQQPGRVAADVQDLEAAATGEQSLESFLLRLDDDQKAYVARFEGKRPIGARGS